MIPTYRITVRGGERKVLEGALRFLNVRPWTILNCLENKEAYEFFVLLTHEQAMYIRLSCNVEKFINVDESIKKRPSCANITR